MDRHHYQSYPLTLARHASETDERMMARLLAFAWNADERLAFSEGLSNAEDPALWRKDLTGVIEQWIDVGQPDDKRLLKACGRAGEVVVYSYASSASIWWNQLAPKVERARNLSIRHLSNVAALASLVNRTMSFQITISEGQMFLTSGEETLEVQMSRWREA